MSEVTLEDAKLHEMNIAVWWDEDEQLWKAEEGTVTGYYAEHESDPTEAIEAVCAGIFEDFQDEILKSEG